MDKKWINKARLHQVLHEVCKREGSTVGKLAKGWGGSVAYTHTLLAQLEQKGDVVKLEVANGRYGKVCIYYSTFHYIAEVVEMKEELMDGSEFSEMKRTQMERGWNSLQWYGYASTEFESESKQMEMF